MYKSSIAILAGKAPKDTLKRHHKNVRILHFCRNHICVHSFLTGTTSILRGHTSLFTTALIIYLLPTRRHHHRSVLFAQFVLTMSLLKFSVNTNVLQKLLLCIILSEIKVFKK